MAIRARSTETSTINNRFHLIAEHSTSEHGADHSKIRSYYPAGVRQTHDASASHIISTFWVLLLLFFLSWPFYCNDNILMVLFFSRFSFSFAFAHTRRNGKSPADYSHSEYITQRQNLDNERQRKMASDRRNETLDVTSRSVSKCKRIGNSFHCFYSLYV